MIFKPELAEKVVRGEKTVTRRVPSDNPRSPWWRERCSYRPGRAYAVQPGRGKCAIGYMRIDSVKLIPLGQLSDEEARLEGFKGWLDFELTWLVLHGDYSPDDLVWRLAFTLIEPDDYPLWEGLRSVEGRT